MVKCKFNVKIEIRKIKMLKFKAYGKTKHANDQGFIRRMTEEFPDLITCSYVATEKMDGTNFCLMFESDGSLRCGSRNRELTEDMNHFDYHNAVLFQYRDEISYISEFCKCKKYEVIIHGELFGNGVLPRIDYGPKKFLPFQVSLDGNRLPVAEGMNFLREIVGYTWWCPLIETFSSLEEALSFDIDLFDERKIEGVVIEPAYISTTHPDLGDFKLKLKTKEFCDITSIRQKKPKETAELSEVGKNLLDYYTSCFNKNRLLDLASKEGMPTEAKQIGRYLKLLCDDVREDLLSKYKEEFRTLADSERKIILGSGNKPAVILIKELILSPI
jgi:hypothetical protein